MSLYDFANGDPINNFDPDGRLGGNLNFTNNNGWGSNGTLSPGELFNTIGSSINQTRMIISDVTNPTQLIGRQYAGLYADNGGYNPNTPEAKETRQAVIGTFVAAATVPIAAFGGEYLAGAYEAGSFGTGAVGTANFVAANAGLGSFLSASGNIATQWIANGGNGNDINWSQVGLSGFLGAGFGAVSGTLGVYTNSIINNPATEEALAERAEELQQSVDNFLIPKTQDYLQDWLAGVMGIGETSAEGHILSTKNE